MSSKRLKKQTAVKYLNGVIERIGEVNRDDSFNYMIARAVVFGSFANNPEYEDFGDLDIGFSMRPKWDGCETARMFQFRLVLLYSMADGRGAQAYKEPFGLHFSTLDRRR